MPHTFQNLASKKISYTIKAHTRKLFSSVYLNLGNKSHVSAFRLKMPSPQNLQTISTLSNVCHLAMFSLFPLYFQPQPK